jgi:uncharacterized membrane protein YkvA (DUF1232 family)
VSKQKRNENQEEQMEASNATLTTRVKDEGFWREMWRQARLVWQLIRSPEVPLYLKILPALAIVYILIPTDLIPDFIPVMGQLDDLTALLVGAKVFIELSPQDVVAKHVRAMRQTAYSPEVEFESGEEPNPDTADSIIIEGDFQVVDNENDNRANK